MMNKGLLIFPLALVVAVLAIVILPDRIDVIIEKLKHRKKERLP